MKKLFNTSESSLFSCDLVVRLSSALLVALLHLQTPVFADSETDPKVTSPIGAPESLAASDFDQAFLCDSKNLEKDSVSKQLLSKVQEAYSEINGLSAHFFQRSKLLGMGDSMISSGMLLFERPGKMNWEYKEPSPQHFITDGTQVWYYEPRVNQLTIGELSTSFSSDIPVSFLLGIGKLDESFDLSRACKNSRGILLELSPQGTDKNLKGFSLLVSEKSFLPIGARLVDVGDTSTEFLFTDLEKDPALRKEQFEFNPPKGVDIVRQNNQG